MTEPRRTPQRAALSMVMLRRSLARHRRGVALAVALVTLLVVSLVAAAVLQSLVTAQRQTRQEAWALQAEWLAEAGIARGEWQLARSTTYTGETWLAPIGDAAERSEGAAEESSPETTAGEDPAARGRVTIRVTADSPRQLIVEAFYPDAEHHRARVRRERALAPPAVLPEESP